MWFGVGHTCAQSQDGETDHNKGQDYCDDLLEIHTAPLVQRLT